MKVAVHRRVDREEPAYRSLEAAPRRQRRSYTAKITGRIDVCEGELCEDRVGDRDALALAHHPGELLERDAMPISRVRLQGFTNLASS